MAEARRANSSRGAAPASSAPNVRRNLFSSQASRPAAASVRSASSALADDVSDTNGSDLVARNPDGGYHFSTTPPRPSETTSTPEQEAEKKLAEMLSNQSRQSSEAGKLQGRNELETDWLMPAEAELLNAIKAGLRRKVASLEDDNWMFAGRKGR